MRPTLAVIRSEGVKRAALNIIKHEKCAVFARVHYVFVARPTDDDVTNRQWTGDPLQH